MSEDKQSKEYNKEAKQAGEQPADVRIKTGIDIKAEKKVGIKSDNKDEKFASAKDQEEEAFPAKVGGLEELPDDIKKKLEKRRTAKKSDKGRGKRRKKKAAEKRVSVGKAYIRATYNNTIVSIADANGNIISWASAGIAGFKGPKKSTPYAAQIITRIAVGKAKEMGLKDVMVFVKGVGTGRESAVRALNANGLNVTYIKDITPTPHNGCRKRKPRRV